MLKITVEYKGNTYSKSCDGTALLALENDLQDVGDPNDPTDVVGWVFAGPFQGKINNCAKRMAIEESKRLASAGIIPNSLKTEDLINSAVNNPDYLNRTARDTIEKEEEERLLAEAKIRAEEEAALAEAKRQAEIDAAVVKSLASVNTEG